MQKEQPSYYSITPATVRYNKKLTFLAKFLYGEITALMNKEGYCWAKNKYFADLYEKDVATISVAINSLKKEGLIRIEGDKSRYRILWITGENVGENLKVPLEKSKGQPLEKSNTNTTRSNTKYNNSFKNKKYGDNPGGATFDASEARREIELLNRPMKEKESDLVKIN